MRYAVAAATGVLCFSLGYLVAWLNAAPAPAAAPSTEAILSEWLADSGHKDGAVSATAREWQQKLTKHSEQLNTVIDSATPEQISHYLDRAFPGYDLAGIDDKRQFSKRLMNEFVEAKNQDSEVPLAGRVTVSTQEMFNPSDVLPREIHAGQTLFAHLDTQGKVSTGMQVFIRWTFRDTGEVLFFMPQRITENSAQNWVSFAPGAGWKAGTYDIRYYQMNSNLAPVAQVSYRIERIIP